MNTSPKLVKELNPHAVFAMIERTVTKHCGRVNMSATDTTASSEDAEDPFYEVVFTARGRKVAEYSVWPAFRGNQHIGWELCRAA